MSLGFLGDEDLFVVFLGSFFLGFLGDGDLFAGFLGSFFFGKTETTL